ncbi:MAG TPA: pseudouridine synthase [Bacillota bacterium]|nr:pseudouridine synthase [Bacillota bacterium]
MAQPERLQKYLARSGVASRRRSEEIVRAGRVMVNGEQVLDPARPVEAGRDRIEVDGSAVAPPAETVVIALYKPRGHVTTASDPQGRPTVLDLAPAGYGRLHPVGRLDADSEGLLLLTNDGDLTFALTHPRHEVEKRYDVWCSPPPGPEAIDRLRAGVRLSDGLARPAAVEAGEGPWLRITLREGRNREVRRLCAAVGLDVRRLRRVAVGPLGLGDLTPGGWRQLQPDEVAALRADGERLTGTPQAQGKAPGRGEVDPDGQGVSS